MAEPSQQTGWKQQESYSNQPLDPSYADLFDHSGRDGGENPNPNGNLPLDSDPVLKSTPGGNPNNLGENPGGDSRDSGNSSDSSGRNTMKQKEFLKAITTITHTIYPPALKPCAKSKVEKPNTFDRSDTWKIVVFIFKYKLYFQNFLKEYKENDKKINFALSYCKEPAIKWFKLWLRDFDKFNEDLEWLYNHSEFYNYSEKIIVTSTL